MTPATIAALVLDAVRAMSAAEREELRALLDLDRPAEIQPDRWMDSCDAAIYLGVHRDTLQKLAAAGAVPNEQDGPGHKRYFSKSALDRWRESAGRFHAASMPPKPGAVAGDSR
jgi:excisionase family DNA binding protein